GIALDILGVNRRLIPCGPHLLQVTAKIERFGEAVVPQVVGCKIDCGKCVAELRQRRLVRVEAVTSEIFERLEPAIETFSHKFETIGILGTPYTRHVGGKLEVGGAAQQ